MAVRIRLTRVGATKRPSYRVVAIDSRRPRDGRSLEILGFYDPLTDPATVQIDADRLNAWIAKGARPSDAVGKLIRIAAEGPRPAAEKAPAKPKAAAKPRARKDATKAEEAPAEAPAKAAAADDAASGEAATATEPPAADEAASPADDATDTAAGATDEA